MHLGSIAMKHLALVGTFALLAHLGWVPGVDRPSSGWLHPYRLQVVCLTLVMAARLGSSCAGWAAEKRTLMGGVGALGLIGLVSGAIFWMMPWILYPADRYSPAMVWLLLGAPTGLVTFGAGILRRGWRFF